MDDLKNIQFMEEEMISFLKNVDTSDNINNEGWSGFIDQDVNSIIDNSSFNIQSSPNEPCISTNKQNSNHDPVTPPAPISSFVPDHFSIALNQNSIVEPSMFNTINKKLSTTSKILKNKPSIMKSIVSSVKNNYFPDPNNATQKINPSQNRIVSPVKIPFIKLVHHIRNDPQLNSISLEKRNKFSLIDSNWLICCTKISNPVSRFFFEYKTHNQKYTSLYFPQEINCDTENRFKFMFNIQSDNQLLQTNHLVAKLFILTPSEIIMPLSLHHQQEEFVFSKTKQHCFKGKIKINVPSVSSQSVSYITCRLKICFYNMKRENECLFSLWSDLFYLKST